LSLRQTSAFCTGRGRRGANSANRRNRLEIQAEVAGEDAPVTP
jgi:hypothetical protein